MMNAIKTCQYDYEDEAWIGVSDTVRHLIGNLLVLDPELRYNMDQVLEHPWIQVRILILAAKYCKFVLGYDRYTKLATIPNDS